MVYCTTYLQIGFPMLFGEHVAPGPQGDGLHGSGFSTHLWFWQTYPYWQSGSRTHSGLQPVIVSGLGIKPAWHRQIGLPAGLGVQVVPGPHGEGLQGFFGLGLGVLYLRKKIVLFLISNGENCTKSKSTRKNVIVY